MSTAFRFLVHARDKLYRAGILPILRLDHPVISVGNLTLGGTGKTPLVMALAEGLRGRGFQPVILSRGYRRTSREVLLASSVGSKWEEVGDEPYLLMKRLPNIPVVVGADRYQAGRIAERKQLGNVFILDDGFQHRRLFRDVDIVTIDSVEWTKGELLLPTGRWREPKSAIARAHIACIQVTPEAAIPSIPIPAFEMRTQIIGIYKKEAAVSLESLRGRAIVAFAGIAKPERFFAVLESLGIQPIKHLRFRDHHRYSRRDIEHLKGEILITTEKDAVRLEGSGLVDFLYLRISANIRDFDRLMDSIISRIRL